MMSTVSAFVKARFLRKPIPHDIVLEITHRCNLDCIYCDRHTPSRNEMSTREILNIISEFHEIGTVGLCIDGGEALIRSDFGEIASHAKGLGMRLRLNSNGIFIPQKVDWIRAFDKVKISLDGGKPYHDSMRGKGSFAKAVEGIVTAKKAGIRVELTCVLHSENLEAIQDLLTLASELDCPIVFQPVRNSLFNDKQRNGGKWMPDSSRLHESFHFLLRQKAKDKFIRNKRASLRHFLHFPNDVDIPCSAGWLECTLDPEGYLYHCAAIDRDSYRVNVRELGVSKAFEILPRFGCSQCWCARTVEDNYLWGLKFHKFL